MNPDWLLKHFDQICEAPGSVPSLRRFILDLAVRGKLVEQDPKDEPASELLKRIEMEKAQLIKEGKIKIQEPQPPIEDKEIEFHLPPNWISTRIGDLLTVIRGASPRPKGDPKYFSSDRTDYHWIKISDIRKHSKGSVLYDTDEFLTEAGKDKSVLLPKGTLVVTNSATIGVPIILGFDGGCIHDGYLAFPYFPESELSQKFFFVLFQTLQSYASKKARGMAQLNLNTGLVRGFPLGLPPLAEQKRIVAKGDELMALCDELEAAQTKREKRRARLVAVTLHGLNNGDESGEPDIRPTLEESARFYFNHLPRLTTRPEHIQQLRQTILSLAVRGKLVPQDPNNKSTYTLISLIADERRRRAIAGEAINTQISADSENGGFPLPQSWRWVKLGFAMNILMGQSPPGETYNTKGEGVPLINGPVEFSDGPFGITIVNQYTTKPTKLCKKGDLLLCVRGSTTGRTNVAGVDACIGRGVAALQSLYADRFIRLFVWSWRNKIIEMGRGIAFPSISRPQIEDLPIPLPPLAEQHRIVAKVENLMALCGKLEAHLTNTAITCRHFLEATLQDALSA